MKLLLEPENDLLFFATAFSPTEASQIAKISLNSTKQVLIRNIDRLQAFLLHNSSVGDRNSTNKKEFWFEPKSPRPQRR